MSVLSVCICEVSNDAQHVVLCILLCFGAHMKMAVSENFTTSVESHEGNVTNHCQNVLES